jgi:hypothetical protein
MLLLNYIGGATNRGVKEVRVGDNFRHTLAMPLPRVLSFCCVNVTSAPVCILSSTAEAEAPRQHLLQSCTCNSAFPVYTCCTLHLTHPPPPPSPAASQEELAAQVDKDLRTMLLVPQASAVHAFCQKTPPPPSHTHTHTLLHSSNVTGSTSVSLPPRPPPHTHTHTHTQTHTGQSRGASCPGGQGPAHNAAQT